MPPLPNKRRERDGGTVTRLQDGQGNLGSIPGEGEIFHYTVQTSSEDTMPYDTPPPSTEVKNSGELHLHAPICLHGAQRYRLTASRPSLGHAQPALSWVHLG
jgi:hypothetical protein